MGGQHAPGKEGEKQPLTTENTTVTLLLALALSMTALFLLFLENLG